MAAEVMAQGGLAVTVFERMPSLGRKLLMAGRGGLNITHSEPMARFLTRYGEDAEWIAPWLAAFPPEALREWCTGLGQPTFVGSSGRVFPTAMKASPLLRAWIRRLDALGVRLVTRAEWTGWAPGGLRFADGTVHEADAVVLAVGGASWPRLGADGGWTALLPDVGIAPLRPANCGFRVDWSAHFTQRFAGTPLKRIALSCGDLTVPGELMITKDGVEGGAIYALSAQAREMIARDGATELRIDLRPDLSAELLTSRLAGAVRESLSNHLRKRAGLSPVAIGLVQEARHAGNRFTPGRPHQSPASALGGARGPGPRHFHRRRPQARRAGRATDAAPPSRRVRGGRNAGLGSANRRLPAASLPSQRPRGGAGRAGVVCPERREERGRFLKKAAQKLF